MPGDVYHAAVEAAREHILAGDIFQVVLAQRFDLDGHHDPFDVYRVLRQVNPSPYMYYVRHPEATLVGSSPEPMVQLLDGRVISRPIAGTRRRGRTEADDRRMAAELSEHPKERAEHVMLVDLARNDVGRVVTFGTERMEELMVLERYSHVMHLTSQVAGELREGASAVDVLRATFPAGTVSGAPKVRAMEIIDALEPTKRGAYAGVVGYLDFSGNLDTAIAIRTMIWRDGHASVQAGAGIVADSVPEDEDLECHNKARALLTTAAAARSLAPLGDAGPRDAVTPTARRARRRHWPTTSPRCAEAAPGSTAPTAGSSPSPDPTRSRSCRRSCPPTSTRSPTATRCTASCSCRRASSTSTSGSCASVPRRRGSTARPVSARSWRRRSRGSASG